MLKAFWNDFKRRVRENKKTRWIRFGIVFTLFILWVIWLDNYSVLPWGLLLFDIYITGYIPFTWWKKSKSKDTRMIMGWGDAIAYALVLVYFIFTFVGQNYQIPSSSLEKTLMTGDFLWVNKTAYGPRVPQTPIHFPLAQNTMPIIGTKSYIEQPQWRYHRLPGLRNVQQGDIVVFNFPAGDTVALLAQNPDIYSMSRSLGEQILEGNEAYLPDSSRITRDEVARALGMNFIRQRSDVFGEVIWRPVDRRENYVKRCVGLPGQTLEVRNGEVYTDGTKMARPEKVQYCYYFTHSQWGSMTGSQREAFWDDLEVAKADRPLDPATGIVAMQGGYTEAGVPLTDAQVARLKQMPQVSDLRRKEHTADDYLFPLAVAHDEGWTIDDYGPITIPAKGMSICLNEENMARYAHTINHYEPHNVEWRQGRAYLDGRPACKYTFEMDYYFMMGDNRHKSADSRYWGFVPEDHIVGHPEVVLISFDPDKTFPFILVFGALALFSIYKIIMQRRAARKQHEQEPEHNPERKPGKALPGEKFLRKWLWVIVLVCSISGIFIFREQDSVRWERMFQPVESL